MKVHPNKKIILVMEQYSKTLWKFLENQDLGLLERLEIAIKLVKEVKRAHAGNVVHRDLKPTNIMVDKNKELVLVDFGIGRNIRGLEGSCGTPGFNAPEQFSGDYQRYTVDIFSLGKNLILTFFKWKIGWNLLWSSRDWISSQKNAEDKLAPFSDLFFVIRQMLQVIFENYLIILIISISMISNNFLQIDSSKRPNVKFNRVSKDLESLAAKIQNNPKIEADWISFHSLIKVPAEFKVDERTLTSLDLFKEITKMNLNAKSGQMVTGGTKLHDQKDTNFCAYFATMSALRHQLRKMLEKDISGLDSSKTREADMKKYSGLKIAEYLERRDKKEKRFERDLSVMIGCVSPRSLSARFKITFKISWP